MLQLFGLEWNIVTTSGQFGIINSLTHSDFGTIYITEFALDDDIHDLSEADNYKVLSILREYKLRNKVILICQTKKAELLGFKGGKITLLTLADIINSYPMSLIEKQRRSLLNMSIIQPGYGKYIDVINPYDVYAKNDYELAFILNILNEKDQIVNGLSLAGNGKAYMKNGIMLKEKAWIELEKVKTSKQAFVAMWFSEEMNDAYLKIINACSNNGFSSFRIDNKEHNNEISGEILYEIRNSQFIISEVTGQRHGVYFEAGYAMGLGLPVIWCCRKDELSNVHFDTRQYNHVVWDDLDELEFKLTNRIKGTIQKT